VSLSAHLTGSTFAAGSNTARVVAEASIDPSIGLSFNIPISSLGSRSVFRQEVNESQLRTANLVDGSYTVGGRLFIGAGPGTGFSEADFFGSATRNAGAGFQVSLTATPLPEPSSLLLFATGLAERRGPIGREQYRDGISSLAIFNLAKF
jgi:hypothetical protein